MKICKELKRVLKYSIVNWFYAPDEQHFID